MSSSRAHTSRRGPRGHFGRRPHRSRRLHAHVQNVQFQVSPRHLDAAVLGASHRQALEDVFERSTSYIHRLVERSTNYIGRQADCREGLATIWTATSLGGRQGVLEAPFVEEVLTGRHDAAESWLPAYGTHDRLHRRIRKLTLHGIDVSAQRIPRRNIQFRLRPLKCLVPAGASFLRWRGFRGRRCVRPRRSVPTYDGGGESSVKGASSVCRGWRVAGFARPRPCASRP